VVVAHLFLVDAILMNGRPGDDPIVDLLHHGLAPYGDPIDTNLRQIAKLLSYPRLQDWFEPFGDLSRGQLTPIVAHKLDDLRRKTEERGWEKPAP
jgi:hypothetical protein